MLFKWSCGISIDVGKKSGAPPCGTSNSVHLSDFQSTLISHLSAVRGPLGSQYMRKYHGYAGCCQNLDFGVVTEWSKMTKTNLRLNVSLDQLSSFSYWT